MKTTTANAVRLGIFNGSAYTYGAYHTGGGAYQTLTVTATVTAGAANVFAAISFMASCTAYIDNATLVVGNQPADYAPLHPADDLARCLRYYERFSAATGTLPLAVGQAYSGTNALIVVPMKVIKPVNPTITVSAVSDWQVSAANFAFQALTGLTGSSPNPYTFQLSASTASGLVGGNATTLQNTGGTSLLLQKANP